MSKVTCKTAKKKYIWKMCTPDWNKSLERCISSSYFFTSINFTSSTSIILSFTGTAPLYIALYILVLPFVYKWAFNCSLMPLYLHSIAISFLSTEQCLTNSSFSFFFNVTEKCMRKLLKW
jgi:hypothetical protein